MSTASANADLNNPKAELKAWEREFRTKNGRDPTREDIKKVPSIDAKYKAYNKARKNSSSTAEPPVASENVAKESRGPSNKPSPTPSSTTAVEPVAHVEETFNPFRSPEKGGPSLSRPSAGSKSNLGDDPFAAGDDDKIPTSSLFMKMKKSSPGSNAFASPAKRPLFMTAQSASDISPSKSILKPTAAANHPADAEVPAVPAPSTSKYVNASSPMKLRALIQQTKAADTPRTKARKRLAGDEDFTPDKRRRMDILRPAVIKRESSEMDVDLFEDAQPEPEPEFGPTPRKPEAAKRFKPLFNSPLHDSKGKGLFAKRSVSFKVPSVSSRESSVPAEPSQSNDAAGTSKRPPSPGKSTNGLLPPSPPPATASSKPKPRKRPRKEKKSQSVEGDEDVSSDKEREIREIPYTRWGGAALKAVRRKAEGEEAADDEIRDFDIPRPGPSELQQAMEEQVEEEITIRMPTDMFDLLDLSSPGKHAKEEDELVQRIFEPGRKNSESEVWVAGEFMSMDGEGKEDDDWEEEADGWKGDVAF